MNDPSKHHDALEFPSGEVVLLHRSYEGQRATVLQLPVMGAPVRAEGNGGVRAEAPARHHDPVTIRR